MTTEYTTSHELIRAFRQLRHMNWSGRRPAEGCTRSETMLLFAIRRGMSAGSPGLKMSEISGILRVSLPTVTQTVNLLVARGLLERGTDPDDRRAVRIRLTEAGRRETEQAEEAMLEGMKGLIDHLGHERSLQLIELLDDVAAYYRAQAAEPPPERETDS